jgi:hypothetical protein
VDADSRSGRAELLDAARLALIPVGVALLFGVLLLPRRAPPGDVPLPVADAKALARSAAIDDELAASARREPPTPGGPGGPLPGPVRALGSALRQYHTLEVSRSLAELGAARHDVEVAFGEARASGDDALLRLRAVQLEGFLDEVRRFESTGVESEELEALAGNFVASLTAAGWREEGRIVPRDAALRTMFKQMWNTLLGVEGQPAFEPTLDEERALYALYLSTPHPTPKMRAAIDAARRGAHETKTCEGVREAERAAVEQWRLERIARLEAIDPSYPAAYARGIASFRLGDYAGATVAFRGWLMAHPEGPYALRARAFLRESETGSGG